MPLGPPQTYLVSYNSYQLPGYAQSEQDPTDSNLVDHYAYGWDGAMSQVTGLQNKNFQMDFKVWEDSYRACKDQYHYATSILRTRRDGFAPLYVDYTDRFFWAQVKTVSYSQNVSQSRKILTYTVQFDCLPWMESTTTHTITGSGGSFATNERTISSGGWTPVLFTTTGGSNLPAHYITVSGYSESEPFTGFVRISGVVTGFEVDTEHTTTTDDTNMEWKNYGLWVAPGKTTFVVTGTTSSVSFEYKDRWY